MSDTPLARLRVVDLTDLAGAYCTRLLADMGAEVLKIEPPEGHPGRRRPPFSGTTSLWFAYFAAGCRSVVVDLDTSAGVATIRRLIATADVVVESRPPGTLAAIGLDQEVLRTLHPTLIWASITPFGLDGPRKNWKTSEIAAWAGVGVLRATGMAGATPQAPAPQAHLAHHTASLLTASGILLALAARRRDGLGQLVDVSMHEAAASMSELTVPAFLDDAASGRLGPERRGLRRAPAFGLYRCSDGWVSLVVVLNEQFRSLAEWVADVVGTDVLADPVFADAAGRNEASELVDAMVEDLFSRFTKLELFAEGQRRRVPVAPCNTLHDLLDDVHLAATGYWRSIDDPELGAITIPGPPFESIGPMAGPRGGAPRQGSTSA